MIIGNMPPEYRELLTRPKIPRADAKQFTLLVPAQNFGRVIE
jgi:hypothetical protein